MKYCSKCGSPVDLRVPDGDNVARHVCGECGEIHYINPKVVVGCVPRWEDRVLLCRRAIEPRYGLWTLPAGFLEINETTIEGAARETLEEASARVRIEQLYALFNLPHVNQVYVMFLADLLEPTFGPGPESLEVALYEERDIPWEQIAFPVVEQTLKLYFADRRTGRFPVHAGDIVRTPGAARPFDVRLLGT
ncbi:MAG TPA: NUDIX hydrolase [Burkholderiales bacterium]